MEEVQGSSPCSSTNIMNNPKLLDNSSIKALRAIAASLVKRYVFRLSLIFSIVSLVIFGISLLLTIISSNWWILLSLISLLPLIFSFIFSVASYIVSGVILPRRLSNSELKKINGFVDEFGLKYAAAKGLKKTPTGLAFLIVWKYISGQGKQSFRNILLEPIEDIKDLKVKFNEIVEIF